MGEGLRFVQSLVSVVFGVICLALSGSFHSEKAIVALILGAIGFFIVFLVTIWTVALAAYDSHLSTWENFAETFGKLDDEARATMGFMFPKIRYTMKRGEVRANFEDTNVSIDLFRLFLQTSNDKYISPRRDWYTKEKPEWAWVEIYEWLKEHDRIVPDSASGSVSWLWNGNSYKHLMAYWMSGRKPVNMNPVKAYAYEEEMPVLESEE